MILLSMLPIMASWAQQAFKSKLSISQSWKKQGLKETFLGFLHAFSNKNKWLLLCVCGRCAACFYHSDQKFDYFYFFYLLSLRGDELTNWRQSPWSPLKSCNISTWYCVWKYQKFTFQPHKQLAYLESSK